MSENEREIDELRDAVGELKAEIERLQEELNEYDVAAEERFEGELDKLREENTYLEDRVAFLEEELACGAEEQIESLRCENDMLIEQLNEASVDAAEIVRLREELRRARKRAAENTEEVMYVASVGRIHFHRPLCHWIVDFVEPHRQRRFFSRKQALDAGLKPCKGCRP